MRRQSDPAALPSGFGDRDERPGSSAHGVASHGHRRVDGRSRGSRDGRHRLGSAASRRPHGRSRSDADRLDRADLLAGRGGPCHAPAPPAHRLVSRRRRNSRGSRRRSASLADRGLNVATGSVPEAIWFAVIADLTNIPVFALLGFYLPVLNPSGVSRRRCCPRRPCLRGRTTAPPAARRGSGRRWSPEARPSLQAGVHPCGSERRHARRCRTRRVHGG